MNQSQLTSFWSTSELIKTIKTVVMSLKMIGCCLSGVSGWIRHAGGDLGLGNASPADRENRGAFSGFHAEIAEQRPRPLPVLSHSGRSLSATGEGALLSRLLPATLVRHSALPPLGHQRAGAAPAPAARFVEEGSGEETFGNDRGRCHDHAGTERPGRNQWRPHPQSLFQTGPAVSSR